MRYEATPRPEIEGHYHIRSLIEGQEKRSSERQYHIEKKKDAAERDGEISSAPNHVVTEFWCKRCKKDFRGFAPKHVEEDWNGNRRIAFYKTKCFNGHWCVRLLTDKWADPYWFRSKAVARDRENHRLDTLQPHETGFNTLYKKI